MCEPISTIAAVAAIAEGAVKVGEAIVSASAQNKQARADKADAARADNYSQNALSAREAQEAMAAGSDIHMADIQEMSAESTARLSAVTAGVTGNDVTDVMSGIAAGHARYTSNVEQNLEFQMQQIARERAGVDAEYQRRVNSAKGANPWATGLQIAGAGLDVFGSLESQKATSGNVNYGPLGDTSAVYDPAAIGAVRGGNVQ